MRSPARRWIAVLVLAIGACDRPSQGNLQPTAYPKLLPNPLRQASLDSVPVTAVDIVSSRQLVLPDSSPYAMSAPVHIAVDTSKCRVAVGDIVDRAVHFFDFSGRYSETLFGGGRDTSHMASISDVDIMPNGTLIIGNLANTIVVYDSEDSLVTEFVPDRPLGKALLGSKLAVADGRILEHWFATNNVQQTNAWEGLPLVREFDAVGSRVRDFGRVRRHPGSNLAQRLERGSIAMRADTLWFARRFSGELLAFGPLDEEPSRSIYLPLFLDQSAPLEVSDAQGEYHSRVEDQLGTPLAVDDAGRFWLVQNLQYPSDSSALFRPTQALAAYTSKGALIGLYDFGLEIVNIAAAGPIQIVALRSRDELWIRAYLLRLLDDELAAPTCLT